MAVTQAVIQVHKARAREFYNAEIDLDPTDANGNTIVVNRGGGLRRLFVVVNPANNLVSQITSAIANAVR